MLQEKRSFNYDIMSVVTMNALFALVYFEIVRYYTLNLKYIVSYIEKMLTKNE